MFCWANPSYEWIKLYTFPTSSERYYHGDFIEWLSPWLCRRRGWTTDCSITLASKIDTIPPHISLHNYRPRNGQSYHYLPWGGFVCADYFRVDFERRGFPVVSLQIPLLLPHKLTWRNEVYLMPLRMTFQISHRLHTPPGSSTSILWTGYGVSLPYSPSTGRAIQRSKITQPVRRPCEVTGMRQLSLRTGCWFLEQQWHLGLLKPLWAIKDLKPRLDGWIGR